MEKGRFYYLILMVALHITMINLLFFSPFRWVSYILSWFGLGYLILYLVDKKHREMWALFTGMFLIGYFPWVIYAIVILEIEFGIDILIQYALLTLYVALFAVVVQDFRKLQKPINLMEIMEGLHAKNSN